MSGTTLRLRRLLALLNVLKRRLAGGLADFRALVALRFDNLEGGALDGLGDGRRAAPITSPLRLLLDTLLVQSSVQLRPGMLRSAALHVERRLGFGVDEDILTPIGPDVVPPVPGVDTEARVMAQISSTSSRPQRAAIARNGAKQVSASNSQNSTPQRTEIMRAALTYLTTIAVYGALARCGELEKIDETVRMISRRWAPTRNGGADGQVDDVARRREV